MTTKEENRMSYELAIGNAERRVAEIQETLDNLAELVIPLRDEIDRARVEQSHWIGGVDTIRNIANLLSHSLDELQDDISKSKAAVEACLGEEAEKGDADVSEEV